MKKIVFVAFLLGSTPALAQGDDSRKIGGLRVEGHVGIERPNLSDSDDGVTYVAKLSSSLTYGAEIGYDIPVSDSVTVGPYVSYDLSSSEKCESGIVTGGAYNYTACFKSKSDLSLGVRAGAIVGSKGEVYLGLGYDSYDLDLNVALTPRFAGLPNSQSASTKNRTGVGVSFGYNHNIAKKLYVGVGMRVSEFGKFDGSDAKLQRFQGHVNLGARF